MAAERRLAPARSHRRQEFGRFYYRFPNGEAGTDVFDRMASFITYLFRSMSDQGYFEGPPGSGSRRRQRGHAGRQRCVGNLAEGTCSVMGVARLPQRMWQ